MTSQMKWFCTDEKLSALKQRGKRLQLAFRILLGITAAAFIVLSLLIRTENAATMHWVLVGCTAVLGWGCILLYCLGLRETRTQAGHLSMLHDGTPEMLEGRLTLTRESIQIPKSIRIRRVLLDTGEEEPVRVSLDEEWAGEMPPEGSLVRVATVNGYIAGMEILEKAGGAGENRNGSRRPAALRKAAAVLPLLGIWAMAAFFIGSFVFYQRTDTDLAHKITIYMDGEVTGEAKLAARLEKGLGNQVRMVQIHPFRYFMFGSGALKAGDLFIIPDSELEQYADWVETGEIWTVYDPAGGTAAAEEYFLYSENETYHLYIGAESVHRVDGLARQAAELLIYTEKEKEETK